MARSNRILNMVRLSKKQALDLLPAVVDQEVNEDEKLAFLSFIEKNEDVRKQYESALRIKALVRERCPKAEAPEHLKKEILVTLLKQDSDYLPHQGNAKDMPSRSISSSSGYSFHSSPLLRYLSATVVILLILFVTIELLDRTSTLIPYESFIVEHYVAEQFLNAGAFIGPQFATGSISEAEQYITDQYGLNVIIPDVKGTEFAGVVMTSFFDGFEVPLLEYEQPDHNESIFIFAFNVDELDTNRFLQRHEQAADKCKQQNDFYVVEVGDHHVVSWLWHDRWYTAISNFNGYDLASLVEPLNYSP